MRLFNGNQKMDEESLKKVFLMQLSNIYSIKTYLVANLPFMANSASFKDLKLAIMENITDINLQLLRMDVIYKLIGEQYNPRQCLGVRALTMEAYVASKSPGMTNLETDLYMLYHLNVLHGLEISCFSSLRDIAQSIIPNELTQLLKQNLDIAKDNKELCDMITKEYIC